MHFTYFSSSKFPRQNNLHSTDSCNRDSIPSHIFHSINIISAEITAVVLLFNFEAGERLIEINASGNFS